MNQKEYYTGFLKITGEDVIRVFGLNFNLGNAFKYIIRYKKKPGQDEKEDLKKAIHYLESELNEING